MQNIEQERHSWIKLTVIFLWLFLYAIATIAGNSAETELNLDDTMTVNLLYFGQLIGVLFLFIVPAVLFAGLWTKQRISYLGISTKASFTTLILASLGILFALPTINWIAQINEQMYLPAALSGVEEWMKNSEAKALEMTKLFTKGTSVGGLLLNLFVVAFMAAISEELFFRGMVQKVLIECFKNKHIAVWTGAILFSAFHMQFFGFFPRMLMGAYLGYLFLWSGSLWPGILAHFFNNGMAVFLIWLSNRGVISADVDKIGTFENEMMYVVTSAVLVTISLILVYKINKQKIASDSLKSQEMI